MHSQFQDIPVSGKCVENAICFSDELPLYLCEKSIESVYVGLCSISFTYLSVLIQIPHNLNYCISFLN